MNASRLVVVAVCAALVASTLVGVTAVPTVAAPPASGFGASAYEEQAGDVARFDLSVPNGSTATLTVNGPAYHVRAVVVDVDDDGHVAVRLNTFLAGWRATEEEAYEAAGVDRVVGVDRLSTRRSAPLATGPYALRLAGPVGDRARLELTAAAFDAAIPYVVPADAHPADVDDVRALTTPNRTVAAGDWAVVTFHASGLGGVARVDDAPVTNLVYATESEPGMESTHVVRHPLPANGSPSTVALDYDAGDGAVPGALSRVSRETIGVGYDIDGDGVVDVDLDSAVAHVTVPRSGRLLVSLADAPSATAGDDLVLELPATNPDVTGTDRVSLAVDGRRTVGTVAYGLAGSGALGNGLDLRVAPVDADGTIGPARTVSPAVHEVFLDEGTDTLSVVFDTRALSHGTHAATLALTPAHPTVSTPRTLSTTFSVVERRLSFVRPGPSFVAGGRTVSVAVASTLAPGTDLRLHVTSRSEPDVIQVYVLTVDATRRASVDVVVTDRLVGERLHLVIRDDGSVVAGPRSGRVVSPRRSLDGQYLS
jgi:hypothetical protein